MSNACHFTVFRKGSLRQKNISGGRIWVFLYQCTKFSGRPFTPKIHVRNAPEFLNVEHFGILSTFAGLGMAFFDPLCNESAVKCKDFMFSTRWSVDLQAPILATFRKTFVPPN